MEGDGFGLISRARALLNSRPARVQAAAPRTQAVRDVEQALLARTLIGVQLDGRLRLESSLIRREAARQLSVPAFALEVERLSAASFLLKFHNQAQRNAAHRFGSLRIRHSGLLLLPWTRQIGARAELSHFKFRVRICIEGVPRHARQLETIASLFPPSSFIDDEPCDAEKPKEEECLRLWLWTTELENIAMAGILDLEEPSTLPQENYADHLYDLGVRSGAMRCDQAEAFGYEVIIHVDRVLEYTPLPGESFS
jgi:hypothetical protein